MIPRQGTTDHYRDEDRPRPMNKTLILSSGFFAGEDYYVSRFLDRGVLTAHSLRPQPHRLMRAARRLHFRAGLPMKSVWFEPWDDLVDEADLVLVSASNLSVPATLYIRSRWPGKRIVAWYWNPSGPGTDPGILPPDVCESWSFDRGDCKKFGLSYNTTYSFRDIADFRSEDDTDFLFVGTNKGRARFLSLLAEELREHGFSFRFCITGLSRDEISSYPLLEPIEPISYEEILRLTGSARTVVELPQAGQTGASLRPLEALMMGKKTLSFSKDILAEPLYDPSRVLVLDDLDIGRIEEFMRTESRPASQELVDYYDFDQWIRRFG